MTNFYLLLAGVLLMGAAPAANAGHFSVKKRATGTMMTKAKKAAKDAARSPEWHPVSQTEYVYEEGEWMLLGSVEYEYDSNGNTIKETYGDEMSGVSTIVRTFDQYNQLLTELTTIDEGDGPTNVEKRTYVYDPVIHNYYVQRMGYDWVDNQWQTNYYCEENAITRNSRGSITEIEKSLPLGNEMTPAYKLNWSYDESTGKANGMAYYYYSGDPAEPWALYDDIEYSNIVWAETDGQMTESDIRDYVEGANRFTSCAVLYNGNTDGYIFAEYSDNPAEYTIKETFLNPDEVGRLTVKKITDNNGSYTVTTSEYFDEDGNYDPAFAYSFTESVTMDEHGNTTNIQVVESFDDIEEVIEEYQMNYVYNEDGNATEVTTYYYDSEADEFVPESRIEYGEYVDTTGVDNIMTDDSYTPAIYYDLMGRRVENPTRGLYIRVQGGKAEKIIR